MQGGTLASLRAETSDEARSLIELWQELNDIELTHGACSDVRSSLDDLQTQIEFQQGMVGASERKESEVRVLLQGSVASGRALCEIRRREARSRNRRTCADARSCTTRETAI